MQLYAENEFRNLHSAIGNTMFKISIPFDKEFIAKRDKDSKDQMHQKSNRRIYTYIYGLKGLACLFIMFGHFSNIYKFASNSQKIDCWFLNFFSVVPFTFFTTERFWLFLFFAISGYLVGGSNIQCLNDVCRKSVMRFLRLLIPVLGTILIVFALDIIVGFHTQDMKHLIENAWLSKFYSRPFTLKDLAMDPINVFVFGRSRFDSPLWVIRDMFLASVLIYASLFIKGLNCRAFKNHVLFWGICLTILIVCAWNEYVVIFCCIIGACGKWLEDSFRILKSRQMMWIAIALILPAFIIKKYYAVPTIVFTLIIISIDNSFIADLLSIKILEQLGTISLGIFMLHWPVFNSFGLLLIEKMYGHFNNNIVFLSSFILSTGITIILSVLFKLTVERIGTTVCKRIDSTWNRFISNAVSCNKNS